MEMTKTTGIRGFRNTWLFCRGGDREFPWIRSGPANQTKERSVHKFLAGAFRNKSSMWIVLVFLRKNTRIHKNGRNSWTFVLALSLVWFAGATPDWRRKNRFSLKSVYLWEESCRGKGRAAKARRALPPYRAHSGPSCPKCQNMSSRSLSAPAAQNSSLCRPSTMLSQMIAILILGE